MVGLVLAVLLSAAAPSAWSGGWRSADAATGTALWVLQGTDTHPSTAPRVLSGGAEHLPVPGQPRSLTFAGTSAEDPVLVRLARYDVRPAGDPRRVTQRAVTPRSPPAL
ncbi:hypothetical protein [Planobispora rosea]|uniref:hypothetical protein n=1 Tax=Planobispora rosea TaxID=35762 RepID=UPI00083B8327|nr:hypothetical protein [Planobispora rosea]